MQSLAFFLSVAAYIYFAGAGTLHLLSRCKLPPLFKEAIFLDLWCSQFTLKNLAKCSQVLYVLLKLTSHMTSCMVSAQMTRHS
jgi:hypothetical protein